MSITLLRYTSLNSASERASKNRTRYRPMFCDVCGGTARSYISRFNMAGYAETETYRQTNDDSETDSGDIEIVGAVLKRGEAAESDDYIVTLYNRTGLSRTMRCQMVLTARSLPMTRINIASAANT